MKKLLPIAVIIFILPFKIFSWTAYVYNGEDFSLYPDSLWSDKKLPCIGEEQFNPGTIGYLPTKLNYLSGEWYMWMTPNTDAIIFKAFTQTPICMLLNTEKNMPSISMYDYKHIIWDFDYKKTFDVYRTAKKKVRKEFMEEALGVTADDNCLRDTVNGFDYFFKDGYLASVKAADGLEKYAKMFKGSEIFNIIQANARAKHANESDVLREINFQFDCMAEMPPNHFKLAYNNKYNYNIALIWFALYGVKNRAQLSDFMICVPDAEILEVNSDSIIMSWDTTVFVFKDDVLVTVK